METQIGTILRQQIERLTQYNGNRSKKLLKNIKNSKDLNDNPSNLTLDDMKQKLEVQAERLKRYIRTNERRNENKRFRILEKQFYNGLRNKTESLINQPPTEKDKDFCENIWSKSIKHNQDAKIWLMNSKQTNIEAETSVIISKQQVINAIKDVQNWKAPGPDGFHNFWLKKFTATHEVIAEQFTSIIKNPEVAPLFLTKGR